MPEIRTLVAIVVALILLPFILSNRYTRLILLIAGLAAVGYYARGHHAGRLADFQAAHPLEARLITWGAVIGLLGGTFVVLRGAGLAVYHRVRGQLQRADTARDAGQIVATVYGHWCPACQQALARRMTRDPYGNWPDATTIPVGCAECAARNPRLMAVGGAVR